MSNRMNTINLKAMNFAMVSAPIVLNAASFGRNLPICGLYSWNREKRA